MGNCLSSKRSEKENEINIRNHKNDYICQIKCGEKK